MVQMTCLFTLLGSWIYELRSTFMLFSNANILLVANRTNILIRNRIQIQIRINGFEFESMSLNSNQ
jgi:hypothetical protein